MQREHGSDDVDFMEQKGGEAWLESGLKTDLKNGIQTESFQERESYFGTNRKDKVEVPSLLSFMWIGLEDFMLWVLLVSGIVSVILEMIIKVDERSTAWLEGFAIIFAVFMVISVSAVNDRKKELEF